MTFYKMYDTNFKRVKMKFTAKMQRHKEILIRNLASLRLCSKAIFTIFL
jgi:hypothetical protein